MSRCLRGPVYNRSISVIKLSMRRGGLGWGWGDERGDWWGAGVCEWVRGRLLPVSVFGGLTHKVSYSDSLACSQPART